MIKKVIIALVSFIVGAVAGYFYEDYKQKSAYYDDDECDGDCHFCSNWYCPAKEVDDEDDD